MKSIEHLNRAAELIDDGQCDDSAVLSEAAGHFWSATFDEEHWPLPLRVSSTALKAKLLARGTIAETIHSLDEGHRGGLALELARFCGEARQSFGDFPGERIGSTHRVPARDPATGQVARPSASAAPSATNSPAS